MDVLVGWPGYSPDMNPIENVWGVMKHALSKERPTTLDGMKKVVDKIWRNLDASYLTTLFDSMPRRMQAVIAASGGPTKY